VASAQAISSALREELRRDDRVLLMGEDIGVFGGAFKVTDGMIEEFGPDRVMDTPLAESGIIGTAIGAAVVGMRPVCEMQFSDFISCGFDQLVNVAGKMYYRQGLAVPITVRLPWPISWVAVLATMRPASTASLTLEPGCQR